MGVVGLKLAVVAQEVLELELVYLLPLAQTTQLLLVVAGLLVLHHQQMAVMEGILPLLAHLLQKAQRVLVRILSNRMVAVVELLMLLV